VTNKGNENAAQFGFVIPTGSNGAAATIAVAYTSNGPAGSAASVTNTGSSNAASFGFVIPVGSNGETGATGPQGPATIAVAYTSNGAPGSAASVTNVGTTTNMELGFVIPTGSNGAAGATGSQGPAGTNGAAATIAVAYTSNGPAGSAASVTNTGSSNAASFGFVIPVGSNGAAGATGAQGPAGTNGTNGSNGTNGIDGAAATITVAYTSNGAPGSAASVTNTGSSNAASFGFVIPVGSNGAAGATGSQGPAGTNGAAATIVVAYTSNGPAGSAASVTNTGSSNAASFGFVIPVGSNGETGATGPVGPITNKFMDANGVVWTITNAPPATGKYVTHFDLTTSNAWFEAENTNVATFAQGATADLALPKSSTNSLAVTALQITGGNPTNGAVRVATDTAGNGKWSEPVFVSAYPKLLNISNTTAQLYFTNVIFQVGNYYNATASTFTPPVGIYAITCTIAPEIYGAGNYYLEIYQNATALSAIKAIAPQPALTDTRIIRETTGTNVYRIYIEISQNPNLGLIFQPNNYNSLNIWKIGDL